MKHHILGDNFDQFWSFLPKPDFSVKIPQTIPQGALIPCQISQKTNEQIPIKLTLLKRQKGKQKDGGKMDSRMDRKTD